MIVRFLLRGMLASALFFSIASQGFCGSPYSANGIGTVIPDNIGGSMSMGGAGIANNDGTSLLRDNPALLSNSDVFSFSLGVLYSKTDTSINPNSISDNGDPKETYAKTNPNVLKIILPVTKNIVLGWGLSPYSLTDVTISIPFNQTMQDNSQVLINDKIESSGGINVSTAGIAVTVKDIVHLGVSFNYNFGMIQEIWTRTFPENEDYTASEYTIKKKFKGYSTTYGVLIDVHSSTSIGLGYTTKNNLTNNNYARSGNVNNPDIQIGSQTKYLPASFRIGVFSRLRERLQAAMDLSFSQWEDAARTQKEKEMYSNTFNIGAGIRYLPSTRINAPYYMKLPLSAGCRYGTLYYKSFPVKDTVTEKAVTFGIEFPLFNELGSIVTSFEYGIRGEMDANGWDEKFTNVGIALITKFN